MTCNICRGEGRLKVGWSPDARKKHMIRIEYDPCPACTPPPHTYFAKRIMSQIEDLSAVAGEGET